MNKGQESSDQFAYHDREFCCCTRYIKKAALIWRRQLESCWRRKAIRSSFSAVRQELCMSALAPSDA